MKDEIISLIEEGGEFALDSILPDGIVRDLPIIGPAFSLIKIGKDIHDRVFIEKLKSFMQDIDKSALQLHPLSKATVFQDADAYLK